MNRLPYSRRSFLLRIGLGAASVGAAQPLLAGASEARALSFVHTHTRESLSVVYYSSGSYQLPALERINQLMRDFRTDELHPIDAALLDQLHSLQRLVGSSDAFEIISGYRSPVTNARLRARSSGVAQRSLHMDGRAIDVRLRGHATAELARLARGQQRGGVGYYRVSDFVHLDTGRPRQWGDPLGT